MKTYRHGKKLVVVNDDGLAVKVEIMPSINRAKKANRTTKHPVHVGPPIQQIENCNVIQVK